MKSEKYSVTIRDRITELEQQLDKYKEILNKECICSKFDDFIFFMAIYVNIYNGKERKEFRRKTFFKHPIFYIMFLFLSKKEERKIYDRTNK